MTIDQLEAIKETDLTALQDRFGEHSAEYRDARAWLWDPVYREQRLLQESERLERTIPAPTSAKPTVLFDRKPGDRQILTVIKVVVKKALIIVAGRLKALEEKTAGLADASRVVERCSELEARIVVVEKRQAGNDMRWNGQQRHLQALEAKIGELKKEGQQ